MNIEGKLAFVIRGGEAHARAITLNCENPAAVGSRFADLERASTDATQNRPGS
jgi:hypothetical protein